MSDYRVVIGDEGAGPTLRVSGDLDLANAWRLLDSIRGAAAPGRTITVDLAGVAFMDSSGIGALVNGHEELARLGSRLVVVNPSYRVADVLEVTGLARYFHIEGAQPS